jgi:prepilin-type N-terminal cleavage/methylation domain-containing protein
LIKRLKDQGGYSLPEVMVAILLLSLAILPMVSMFDAGLRAATLGGNYDKARAIANEELEEIRALPFSNVVSLYPPGATTACTAPIEAGFGCQVRTDYARLDGGGIVLDPNAKTMVQATVTVTWGGSKSYGTTGLVSKGTP